MRWLLAFLLSLAAFGAAAADPPPPFFTAADCPAEARWPDGIAAQCGTVTVLEDRSRLDGPRLRLQVATLWRTGQDLAPDPLLFIQGGPALVTHLDGEGLGVWAKMLLAWDWLGRRRLVLFDQRGVGTSPALPESCDPFDLYAVPHAYDRTQPPQAERNAMFRRNAKRCWARYRDSGHDPNRFTTADSAADVADLRVALGHPAWNIWGVSFGSRIALATLRDHPAGIRSVIVEGVVPPEANIFDSHAADVGGAFDALTATCRADPACDGAYPDLAHRFLALAEEFDRHPRTIHIPLPDKGSVAASFDGTDLQDLMSQMLAGGDEARLLPRLVAEAEAGALRQLESMKRWQVLITEYQQADVASDVYISTICADLHPAGSGWLERSRARDPRFAALVWDIDGDGDCAAWPVAHSSASDAAPVTSAVPTLLISGAFDPVTPPSWAEAAARRLAHGYSYVFPGRGHGVLIAGQPCARRIAGRFLDDPAHRPDEACFANLAPPIFEPPRRRP